ncbi:hypothetical protein M5K25_009083 [Dendrobium thyrsiflorum]|uniref:Uncharacterized protein n=1 Tax=Dendrobium thyrsiflorum TaxID=117978 RepID=A0ABD0VBV6_DENTH
MSQKYKPNETKFDSIRAQMSPNQRPKAPLEASNHNLSYQMGSKCDETINRPLISHKGGPKQGREEKEEDKLVFSCHQSPPRPPPRLSSDCEKEGREEARREGREEARKEKEEDKLEFSCHQIPPRSPPDFHLAATRRRNSVRLPINAGLLPGC